MTYPARLTRPAERFLELESVRYEFPENDTDDLDANWLMIRTAAANEK